MTLSAQIKSRKPQQIALIEVTRFIDIRQRHGLDLAKLAPPTGSKIVLNILLDEENAHAFLAIILDFVEMSAE